MKTTLILLLLLIVIPAHAKEEWVAAQPSRSLPGDASAATTMLSKVFEKRRGQFRAVFESVLDNRDSVSGTFLVGKYRYLYAQPVGDGRIQPRHDEMIAKVVLDCANHLSGTLSTIYLLAGKTVGTETASDRDVVMTQYTGRTTVSDLCDLAKKQGTSR